MTEQEKEDLKGTIENEGFDYAFVHYSNFEEIKDKKFHELRDKYVEVAKELSDYN